MSAQRRLQIIEATIRCIGTHGIADTTLDKIAEECGMARGHVRHFIGNRDELLVETTRYFFHGRESDRSVLPSTAESLDEILDFLFGTEFTQPGSDNAVVLGLVEASRTNPAIAEVIVQAYEATQTAIAAALEAAGGDVAADQRMTTAYGVLTLALGNVFLADLDGSSARNAAARALAVHLIEQLGETKP